jgi:predicted AlkP superfamily phosphohydrolase/phosphomutase
MVKPKNEADYNFYKQYKKDIDKLKNLQLKQKNFESVCLSNIERLQQFLAEECVSSFKFFIEGIIGVKIRYLWDLDEKCFLVQFGEVINRIEACEDSYYSCLLAQNINQILINAQEEIIQALKLYGISNAAPE